MEAKEKFCKCGKEKTPFYTQGETRYFCPTCEDPFDRAEDKRLDVLDMMQEMERGDDE